MRVSLLVLPLSLFLVAFFYLPFLILAYQSLESPYGFTFENYQAIFKDPAYLRVITRSMILAGETTILSFMLSFPAALYVGLYASSRERGILLGLIIIPFWIDILLRSIAIKTLLYAVGLREGYSAMLIGMVYDYLPLMFLPLYVSSSRIPHNIIDAGRTIGAGRLHILARILIPLMLPGILAGSLLVFLMSVTEFVIPALLGGTSGFTVGSLIYYTFLSGGSWGIGAALTVLVVVSFAIVAMIAAYKVEVESVG